MLAIEVSIHLGQCRLNAHNQVYNTTYWKKAAENERIIKGILDQGLNPAVPGDTVNYHVTRVLDGDHLSVNSQQR